MGQLVRTAVSIGAVLLSGFSMASTAFAQPEESARAAPPALTIATCLQRIGADRARADMFRLQTGVFRIEQRAADGAGRFVLRGSGHIVDAQQPGSLFLTSAHTFRALLRDRRAEAQRSTLQGADADGAVINYSVYLFPNELAASGFRLWRPLVSVCNSSTTSYEGEDAFGFKIARLVLIDPPNREIHIVGMGSLDETLNAALVEIVRNRRPIADLYDFALLRSADWRNPQGVVAVDIGARVPNSTTGGASAGVFYGYGHRDATGRPVYRSLQGTVLEGAARPQYDAIGGGSFRGDSGAMVVSVGNMGAGLVTATRATGSGACFVEDADSVQTQVAGPLLVVRDGAEDAQIDAQCLSVLQASVVVSPLEYLSAPAFVFFFEPFRRNPASRIDNALQAALADPTTQEFAEFSREPTLPDSIRLHASYQKYRPSPAIQRLLVAGNQRYWSNVAYERLGYGRWRDEVLDDYERASRELTAQPEQITAQVARIAVRDAEQISADACSAALPTEQRTECRASANRAQFAAMELAVVAASRGRGVEASEGADLAVRLDDFRRNNRDLAERSVLADREVRDIALTLDREAVFRREGGVSDAAFEDRLNRFEAQVGERERIERRNNQDVYVIDRGMQQNAEVPVGEFRERIERERIE